MKRLIALILFFLLIIGGIMIIYNLLNNLGFIDIDSYFQDILDSFDSLSSDIDNTTTESLLVLEINHIIF